MAPHVAAYTVFTGFKSGSGGLVRSGAQKYNPGIDGNVTFENTFFWNCSTNSYISIQSERSYIIYNRSIIYHGNSCLQHKSIEKMWKQERVSVGTCIANRFVPSLIVFCHEKRPSINRNRFPRNWDLQQTTTKRRLSQKADLSKLSAHKKAWKRCGKSYQSYGDA